MPHKKILVVEDNLMNRMMLCEILASQYEILEAGNGEEALQVLREYGEAISLILLDIVMPVMDGYTFLSIMKADSAYASIPVIVTTQSDGESDEVAALSHGATDFVAKPYKPKVILHRVASIINLRETAAMINLLQYDRLTGLYSKEFFYQRVKELLAQKPQQKYDIICSNIENFKLVNDIFGVPVGDRMLCSVAGAYRSLAGSYGICGRLNADQFVCLLEHRWEYTDEMFIRTSAMINQEPGTRDIVLKWGIYEIKDRSTPVEQMCDWALVAARSIKGQYGKYFARYDNQLRDKLLHEQEITDSMESALAQEQFEIYLQPKYRIENDSLAGAEALVRWNHPQWGLQSPDQFIPLFEKNGFITKLDQFVWDKACEVLQQWHKQGYDHLSISVNVSRADIYNDDLADTLMRTVRRHELAPSRLHLEITESAYTENPHQIIETVGQLRQLGFIVEMDDFGSGYSSLNMLNQMPLDILKLDMKFIQSETAKPTHQGILRFIMGLARSMHLSVVAEGVETKKQLECLREIGCDYVQGYYFARPMPCVKFEQILCQAHAPSSAAEEPVSRQPEQILLVVDEDEDYRREIRAAFRASYQVVEVSDGDAALAAITRYGAQICAALLSVNLVSPDGFTVLKILQREKIVWNIPIIATGPPDAALEARALEMGAEDYAAKPHLPSSLYWRLSRVIGLSCARRQECDFRQEAYRDYLTGLLNRRGLIARVATLRAEDGPLGIYLFDLDDLKRINDTLGHSTGDRVIECFGAILRAQTRDTDVLARYGGDEFVAVMKHIGSEETALQKGRQICRAVGENSLFKQAASACSAGITIWDMQQPLQEAIDRADRALYQAKAASKGGCRLWENKIKRAAKRST